MSHRCVTLGDTPVRSLQPSGSSWPALPDRTRKYLTPHHSRCPLPTSLVHTLPSPLLHCGHRFTLQSRFLMVTSSIGHCLLSCPIISYSPEKLLAHLRPCGWPKRLLFCAGTSPETMSTRSRRPLNWPRRSPLTSCVLADGPFLMRSGSAGAWTSSFHSSDIL